VGIGLVDELERWLGKFEQRDKWIAGLTAAMMAAAQEA
jgi:hypothetical protein